ncbi:MAG TPA: hypothetical protein EYG21_01035 [Nitrospinaceae bacterium]|nr:hypothetical protein [Nitrospinaceae bacterium]
MLEACNWSEERAEELVSAAQSIITNATSNVSKNSTVVSLKKEIVDQLTENFSDAEIDAILILVDNVAKSPEEIAEEVKYEC